MERFVQAVEARREFARMVDDAAKGDQFVIERNGQPVVAVMPMGMYEELKLARLDVLSSLRAMQQQANMDENEADSLADEAVRAVRSGPRPSGSSSTPMSS